MTTSALKKYDVQTVCRVRKITCKQFLMLFPEAPENNVLKILRAPAGGRGEERACVKEKVCEPKRRRGSVARAVELEAIKAGDAWQ
jgi:hypothetical protein